MDNRWKSVDEFLNLNKQMMELLKKAFGSEDQFQKIDEKYAVISEQADKNNESRGLLGPIPVIESLPETTTELTTAIILEEFITRPCRNQFVDEFLDKWASEIHQNEVNSFLSRMGFPSLPSFSGVKPKDWIKGIEEYFEVYPSMEIYQFSLVEGLLVGRAKEWDASWSFDGNYDDYWNEFVDALCDRFENDDDEKVDESVGYESIEEKHLVVGKDSAIDVVLLVESKCCNIVEGLCEIEDVTNKEFVVESCESTKELGSEITLKIKRVHEVVHEVCQEHNREVRDVLLDVLLGITKIPRKEIPVKFDVVTQEMGYNHLCDIVCALGMQAVKEAWSRKVRGDWFDAYAIERGKISSLDVCRDRYDFDVKSKPPDDSGNILEVAPLADGNFIQCILSDSCCIIHGDSKINHPKIALESLDCATVDVWFLLLSVNYKDTSQSADKLSFLSMIQKVLCVCLRLKFWKKFWQYWPRWRSKILEFQGNATKLADVEASKYCLFRLVNVGQLIEVRVRVLSFVTKAGGTDQGRCSKTWFSLLKELVVQELIMELLCKGGGHPNITKIRTVYGIVRMLRVVEELYLVLITECECVGSYLGYPIFKVSPIKVFLCDHALKTVSAEQEKAESRFLWNNYMLEMLIYVFPVVHGSFQYFQAAIGKERDDVTLIARRCTRRNRTRMWRRKAASDGYVARFVKTEQIVQMNGVTSSLVQVRGSKPFSWEPMVCSPILIDFMKAAATVPNRGRHIVLQSYRDSYLGVELSCISAMTMSENQPAELERVATDMNDKEYNPTVGLILSHEFQLQLKNWLLHFQTSFRELAELEIGLTFDHEIPFQLKNLLPNFQILILDPTELSSHRNNNHMLYRYASSRSDFDLCRIELISSTRTSGTMFE